MRTWIRGAKALILEPEAFFREHEETRTSPDHAVMFLVVASVILGVLRYTTTPFYAGTTDWYRPVMASILVIPGLIYTTVITSLFAQAVISRGLSPGKNGEDRGILSAYKRTFAVFCYVMVFPALLLWIPPFLPWSITALPLIIAIATYTTYNALFGLAVYHNLPVLAAVCEHPGNISEHNTSVKVITLGTVLLLILQFTLIGVPDILL